MTYYLTNSSNSLPPKSKRSRFDKKENDLRVTCWFKNIFFQEETNCFFQCTYQCTIYCRTVDGNVHKENSVLENLHW